MPELGFWESVAALMISSYMLGMTSMWAYYWFKRQYCDKRRYTRRKT